MYPASRSSGPEFVDEAFIAAREADPDVKLYYNDCDTEDLSNKANNAFEMVRSMVEREIPIDGVGLQSHLRIPDDEPSLEELRENIRRHAELGLEVFLSELDVRLCAQEGETLEDQAQRIHDVMQICMEEPLCNQVTVWGITDRYSWLNNQGAPSCPSGETPFPLLWDDNYQKKPGYFALLEALVGL
jgi:endo-1,4-beta-xylanase